MLSRCFLIFSVCVGAFIIGLSQICSFFSQSYLLHMYVSTRSFHGIRTDEFIHC